MKWMLYSRRNATWGLILTACNRKRQAMGGNVLLRGRRVGSAVQVTVIKWN